MLSCMVVTTTVGILACLVAAPVLPTVFGPFIARIFQNGTDSDCIYDSMRYCAGHGRLPENWGELKVGFDAIYGEGIGFGDFENSDAFYENLTTRIEMNFVTFQKINRELDTGIDPSQMPMSDEKRWVFRWKDCSIARKFQRERFDMYLDDVKRAAFVRQQQRDRSATEESP